MFVDMLLFLFWEEEEEREETWGAGCRRVRMLVV